MMKTILFCLLTSMSITFFISCDKIETAPILSGINQLQKQNDSLLQLVIQLQTSLDSVQNRVNQNTTLLNTINTNVTGLQNSVATLIANITLLKSKMDSANANISSIQLQVTTLAKQYTSLSNQISNVFSVLSNQIDSLSIQTSANTVLLNLLQTNYLTTQIKVDSILLQIQINNQLLATNNSNVAQIQTQLIALTTEYNNVIILLNQLIVLINNQSLMPSNGLVAYYPFTGNANDSSGNGNNGTVYGATLTTDRFGNANNAYSFNGTNNYIQTNFQGIVGSNSRTLAFWAKSTSSYNMCGASWGVDTAGKGFFGELNYHGNGITADIASEYITYTPTASTSDGKWHHYTYTFDSSNPAIVNSINVYMDGIQLTNIFSEFLDPSISLNTEGIYPLQIGKCVSPVWPVWFSGSLDEIRIYNRALTQSEITYLATH